jgi:hypothetical protein
MSLSHQFLHMKLTLSISSFNITLCEVYHRPFQIADEENGGDNRQNLYAGEGNCTLPNLAPIFLDIRPKQILARGRATHDWTETASLTRVLFANS